MSSSSSKLACRRPLILALFAFCLHAGHAQNNECSGTETFEKISGTTLRGSNQIPLFSSKGNTVTAECNNRCRASPACRAFVIDYGSDSCARVEWNTDDNRNDLVPVEKDQKVNYFERICLKVPACEKAWIYERVPGYELAGYDDRTVQNVASKLACQELCLRERSLPCRSAEYNYETNACVMSKETRRTQPAAYRASINDVDYLENQCSVAEPTGEKNCDYLEYADQDIGLADLQISSTTKNECRSRCDGLTAFNCRSFTFFNETNSCRLSGDDNLSAGPYSLETRTGATYYQKAPCVDSNPTRSRHPRQTLDNEVEDEKVSLVCTSTSMTVTLNTEEEFSGKLFAYKSPRDCSTRGSGELTTSLTFQYEEPEERCGTERQDEGVFTNTIVIQHHPIIQQKGDRAIKLYCFFDVAGDKVVTNSYDVISETVEPSDPRDPDGRGNVPGIPTSIVNGTAPQPRVLLRIVDSEGNDITGTRLGEALFLRIELDGDSIFDIFARNLIAQSGLDDEEIKLLDERGCPTDPVFPGLTKDESGALNGRFEAFKFSDTTVVNFQVNVQFCQGRCNPVDCGNGVQSYGKRRKRRDTVIGDDDIQAERLVYDPNLDQEVLVFNTPLRKQIRVNSGTTIDPVNESELQTAGGRGGVFVVGDFHEDDVFCASWTVVIVTAISFIFLQVCILVVCVLCIYAGRRTNKPDHEPANINRSAGPPSSVLMGSSAASSNSFPNHDHAPPPFGTSASMYHQSVSPPPPSSAYAHAHAYGGPASVPGVRSRSSQGGSYPEHSASTLKSLRTSLRD